MAHSLKLNVGLLQLKEFNHWYQSRRLLNFTKEQRKFLDDAFSKEVMPTGVTFEAQDWSQYQLPDRITLLSKEQANTVLNGSQYFTWEVQFLPLFQQYPVSIEESNYEGTSLPPSNNSFPKSVPVRVHEIKLSLGEEKIDALQVDLLINQGNLEDVVSYFATAYSPEKIRKKVLSNLGNNKEKWIPVIEFFEGWPALWANRFPAEKTQTEKEPANDVCHGVARQFFMKSLENNGEDRSTEASEWLLKTHYQVLKDGIEPGFGDYLYLPGAHSIRFMLKEPSSGRWIGFSSWSSANTPYRLWWVDQDYLPPRSGKPAPPADPLFPQRLDLWRRLSTY